MIMTHHVLELNW